jgi:hypothetical protein
MTIDYDCAKGNRAAAHKPTPWHEGALSDRLAEVLTQVWVSSRCLSAENRSRRASITQVELLIPAERIGRQASSASSTSKVGPSRDEIS